MPLWVPPKVACDLREETAAHNAATLGMFDYHGPVFDEWNHELRNLDPYLRLGKAKEHAAAIGVIPGFYHLIRINPNAPLWTMPLHDEQGRFVEPSSRMLQVLRERDMQNMQITRARLKAIEEKGKQEDKAKLERIEKLTDEGLERYKAYTQVRIPFHTDSRWSQNVAGRRGARK